MNKKILLFSCDPGGCNVVSSLALTLRDHHYSISLFGKDGALTQYKQFGLIGKSIEECLKKNNKQSFINFLKHEKPDFIITGTSANDFSERYLWQAAEKLQIKTFAVLDQWMNYGIRFSKYKISQISKFAKKNAQDFLPSEIIVMDSQAKSEAIDDGLPARRIFIGGQPYFDYLTHFHLKNKNYRKKKNIKKSAFVITFASEPISADFKNYWGYTEISIFQEVILALRLMIKDVHREFIFIIKIHPREDGGKYEQFIKSIKDAKRLPIKFIIEKAVCSWNLISASDLVIGMSSMFLIESVLMKKPTLSVQIGLKRESPFIFDKRKILPSIKTSKMLKKELKSVIVLNKKSKIYFSPAQNSCEKIINFMEQLLCKN